MASFISWGNQFYTIIRTQLYKQELGDLPNITFMPINDWNEPNYWLSCIQLTGKVRPLDVIDALEKENIESRPLWKPMHLQPFYANCDYIGQGVSDTLFENGLCLPSDTKMTDDDLARVVKTIRRLWK